MINSTNEYCHKRDAVLNTFCATHFCHPEMFQFLKDELLSLTEKNKNHISIIFSQISPLNLHALK